MQIKLPNGLIEGADLFNYATIDELRGKQQNYLSDIESLKQNYVGHIPKIIKDMLLSLRTEKGIEYKGDLKEVFNKLASGDLETILVKIREKTYGPKYRHEATCEHCGYTCKNLSVRLDELELYCLDSKEITKPTVLQLPKSQKEVELRPHYFSDLQKLMQISDTKRLYTTTLALSIKRLGDKTEITPEDLEDIYANDLEFLKDNIESSKVEGKIDTNLEITCQNKECGKDFTAQLNAFDPSFLLPTKESPS